MRLPAPRARRRSTVLGEPFLRAVSTGTTNAAEPPQPVEAPPAQSVDPFRGMVNLLNSCLKAEREIADIEEALTRDPDALSPDEIVAPVAAVLADTQADLERMPPGPARRRVVEAVRREGLALTDRVLEADARADRRFKEGTINAAADRMATKVARDPGALDASLTMLNDLIETADLDPSDKRLIAANLEARLRDAAEPPDASLDAPVSSGEEPASGRQLSSSRARDQEEVAREGKSDALTPASEGGDVVEIARQREPGLFEISPETAERFASKIRKLQAALNADRGDGKSFADAQEEFANQVDQFVEDRLRKNFGEHGESLIKGRDEVNAALERGYRELRQWLHGEIDRIGEENGYSDRHIANLKLMADTTVVTISIIGPGGRRGRGGRDGEPDGRDDPENRESEQRDRDNDQAQNEDEPEGGGDGSRSDGEDGFDRIDVSKIKVPKLVKTREPLTGEELRGILERGETRIDPHRLRTVQDHVGFKFKQEGQDKPRMLVQMVRDFFTKKDLAASVPEIKVFVDGEGKVWTLDHRRVVAARVATQVAEKHGLDTVFKLRFKVVSVKDPDVLTEMDEKLRFTKAVREGTKILGKDGLSIEVERPQQRF